MQNNFFCVKRALTDGDLKQFETEYNIAMPLKIREHYLKYNGGYPERNVFCSVEDEKQYIVNFFRAKYWRWRAKNLYKGIHEC